MTAPDAYEEEIERWREARLQRLRSPNGWLTLVDRLVLEEGDNQLAIGLITLQAGQARFRPRPGTEVTLGGVAIGERVLRTDQEGPPDLLESGGRSYELYRRGDLFVVRVKDPQAPARLAFPGLDYFPLDRRWRIRARFESYRPPRHTMHAYDIGAGWRRMVPGLARFAIDGQALALEPILEEDSSRLFFNFGDGTNHTESYPAGRFLYADRPAGDEVLLDFNTAFNPPCAFTPFATCPVTPPQNRLPVAIPAGERRPRET